MNNLLARSLGIFLICIFLIAEYYSISSAFSDGLQEFSDRGWGTFILGNLFNLILAILLPFWAILFPLVIIFFSIVIPIGGIAGIYRFIFRHDSISSLILGLGLCFFGYFYTTKVSIPIIKNEYFTALKEFFDYLLNFIS